MGIITDIIIIAIIALSTFLAYRKGLAALAIKLCAVIIALLATLILYRPIANFIINTTNIDETIQNAIYEKSMEAMNGGKPQDDLSKELIDQVAAGQISQTAKDVSIQIINMAVIVILFFAIKFALKFVTAIANKVAKLPIINQFNKAGGIVYGLIRGAVIVYTCLLLISFAGQLNQAKFLSDGVNNSYIGKMMYENNLIKILL